MNTEDGNLPAALAAFRDAVHQLVEPTVDMVQGVVRRGDSLYTQLDESLGGTADHPGGGGGNKSKPPVWIEALELIRVIDHTVMVWQPGPQGPDDVPETVWRLNVLSARSYRPQDIPEIDRMTESVLYWVESVNKLLDPPTLIPLVGDECPVCKASEVRRINDDGEFVRAPALLVEFGVGVSCQNRRHCRDENTSKPAFWSWDQREFLGRLLLDQREAKKNKTEEAVA